MRIIGIRVRDGRGERFMSPTELMRGVKDGWFPFGDYPMPNSENWRTILEKIEADEGFYNTFSQRPRISIAGIVGKNGSGKSSILDYLLMIVNNAACQLLYDQYADDEEKPKPAHGLYADLYYETSRRIIKIGCKNTDVTIGIVGHDIETRNLDQDARYRLASDLFYLIQCNYGNYSLNSNDYVTRSKINGFVSKVNGDWLNGIFNLEQNYIFPITITPHRNGGNIDVNELKEESVEKLIALMLFAKSRGYQFMAGYELSRFKFEYKTQMKQQLTARASTTATRKKVGEEDLLIIASSMTEGWAEKLQCIELYFTEFDDKKEAEPHEVFRMLLEYMGYVTLHLCVYYEKFRRCFDVIKYVENHQRNKITYEQGFIPDIDKNGLFDEIRYDHSNLTYGLRKCINTVEEVLKTGLTTHPYLSRKMSTIVSDLKLNGEESLEEILFRLPPPLYQLDALMVKDEADRRDERYSLENSDAREIQLSKLSSGEKQFLYSLSATLFHIKSMDESIARTKGLQFKDVCLVFDEAELYYHPEFQQDFVFNLLRYLSWLRLGYIESIQIVIATHSPFILSDIKKENILFMRDGQDYRVSMTEKEAAEFREFSTFGANYYDLLRNGFFLRKQATGRFAAIKVEELRKRIMKGERGEELQRQITAISDPIVKGYLLYELNQGYHREEYVQD